MPSILDKIVVAKREELARQKGLVPLEVLQQGAAAQPSPLSLSRALLAGGVRLIAEVKQASPSRGLLCPDFDPVRLAGIYAANGAAAISVLTDPRFQGELEHLAQIKGVGASQNAPVLRKDFIFDPYQVYEARSAGADALLLIVAILSPQQLGELLALSRRLGMQCLVEVHDEADLGLALEAGAEVIGINNRDLRTFSADLAVTEELAPLVPRDKVLVSESGISTREHVKRLGQLRVNAVLVGEALVTAPDVAQKVRELVGYPVASKAGEALLKSLGVQPRYVGASGSGVSPENSYPPPLPPSAEGDRGGEGWAEGAGGAPRATEAEGFDRAGG